MSNPSLPYLRSLEGSVAGSARPSLFHAKDAFIERMAPVAWGAIFFGSFSLTPRDVSLSRQALFKLSFLHRHFLQPAGLRISGETQTAILSGSLTSRILVNMADILARQIEGIRQVRDETAGGEARTEGAGTAQESIRFLFVTDQTLHSGVQVISRNGRLILEG